MLKKYKDHVEERLQQGIPPLPLNAEQVADLVELLKSPPAGEEEFILDLIKNRTPAGVDPAAYVKAAFLPALAKGETSSPLIDKKLATELLGTMLGGYNVESLIKLLKDEEGRIFKLIIPASISSGLTQINVFIDMFFASSFQGAA